MITMLVIYDETGRVLVQGTGMEEPVGVPFLYADLESGEYVTKVDVGSTPHSVVTFKSTSDLDVLKEQVENLNIAIAELMGV